MTPLADFQSNKDFIFMPHSQSEAQTRHNPTGNTLQLNVQWLKSRTNAKYRTHTYRPGLVRLPLYPATVG